MKYKHVTLIFIVSFIVMSILLVPTLKSHVEEDYTLTLKYDVTHLTQSSFTLQPIWNIGQTSERIKIEKFKTVDDKEYDTSTSNIKRTTITYLYRIHWMILSVLLICFIIISKVFYKGFKLNNVQERREEVI